MPPKKPVRSTSTGAAKKKSTRGGDSEDLEFLGALTEEVCTEKEVMRLTKLMADGREKRQKDVLVACAEALERLCQSTKILMLLKEASVIPTIAAHAADPSEVTGKYMRKCVEAMCRGVVIWLDAVDPIDFMELANLLFFAHELGGVDEDLAMSALGAIERFAHHRPEHIMTMLENGVLRILHAMLSEHRNSEFVEEVFNVFYLLCDLPCEGIYEHLEEELDIIKTVVQMLKSGPLNLRLQLAGLRLIGVIYTRAQTHSEDICQMVRKAGAQELVKGSMQKLLAAGFPDHAAWLHVVAGRVLGLDAPELMLAASGNQTIPNQTMLPGS
mmetsp:Transcript_9874/g.21508  ORF Transcript_9874/g.21508 Transcript_9874/m.21508 type:complete len:328 (+) Transcript_9874:227-1210(+)